ncbi:hypothetical protein [Sutcliffiella horikoshii]|uniref:hypothetical protein n=1 Tax=Sutcliffiella horikoshii TaxID=79883 RepID=UPI001CFD9A2C|nr:hypothetical protein [Sutcliffiella horikoshii]
MIFKKILTSLTTTGMVFVIFTIFDEMAFSLFIQMYLLPTLLFYGVPVSLFADYLLKSIDGFFRVLIAMFIHLLFAVVFILVPTILGWKWDVLYFENLTAAFKSFIMLPAILSAFIFWCFDEIHKTKAFKDKCRYILGKIGELRI